MEKKPWESKTTWMALVVAVAAFVPPVQAFVTENMEMVGVILGGVFTLLRLVTKSKISIS